VTLEQLKIQDPFPNESKIFWIRYVRSGDGQRFNEKLQVSGNGTVQLKEITIDME